MSYVKLCALSVSYCTIIATAVALIIFAAGVIAAKTTAGIDMQTVGLSVMSAAMLIIVIFVTMTHRIFWGMRRWVALAVTLAIAALSWGVVYPFLTTLAERAGISTSIGRFLGDSCAPTASGRVSRRDNHKNRVASCGRAIRPRHI